MQAANRLPAAASIPPCGNGSRKNTRTEGQQAYKASWQMPYQVVFIPGATVQCAQLMMPQHMKLQSLFTVYVKEFGPGFQLSPAS